MKDDMIYRQAAIDALKKAYWDKNIQSAKDDPCIVDAMTDWAIRQIKALPSTQPEKRTEERTETHSCDLIDREAAVDAIYHHLPSVSRTRARTMLHEVPSAQLGQRYTNEELEIFQHGISLSLLSKRSAQHWRYDENMATEIKFLERLYEKVSANMRGGQNE